MILIRKMRWKNILSFGNSFTEMDFSDGKISLVVGENGNGKSAIYEALFFVLYGKPFRDIRKGGLVNSINGKELVVEIEIEKAAKKYLVCRGIKPDVFEIHIDGKLKNQDSSVKDYQEFLETNVLQMDEKTFRQVVILGSDFFTPFMKLSAGERRVVVEDFLNVGIYSVMHQKAKAKISALNLSLKDASSKIEILKVKSSMKKEELERVTMKGKQLIEEAESKISDLKAEVADREKGIAELESRAVDGEEGQLRSRIRELTSESSTLSVKIGSLDSQLSRETETTTFFNDNHVCPTCDQGIDEGHKEKILSDCAEKARSITERLGGAREELARVNAEVKSCQERLNFYQDLMFNKHRANVELVSSQTTLRMKEMELENLLREVSEVEEIRKQIKDINRQGKVAVSEHESLEKEKSEYEAIGDLLKDGGIKNRIVKDYLPVINSLIRRYLDILEFPVSFTFDENFDETIRCRGRDEFSYGNFSAGERLRLDLALLFTWRELTRIKSSAYCNVLILDEIGDSSLDAAGFDAFMKILNADRSKQSVMIISHKPQGISSRVDTVIEVAKRSGFSCFESVTENDEHEQLL